MGFCQAGNDRQLRGLALDLCDNLQLAVTVISNYTVHPYSLSPLEWRKRCIIFFPLARRKRHKTKEKCV